MLILKVIDCENYIYISNNDRYSKSLDSYLFDGKSPEKTNKEYYYKLDKIPTSITKKKPKKRINIRYELKKGYTSSDMMPEILTEEMVHGEEYDEVINLYSYKYDEIDDGYEAVEFVVNVIYGRKDFEFIPRKYKSEVDLLTQIECPEEIYQEKPCRISSEDMLNLIRSHVKRNIDTRYATITSDYDFHFEVKKKIDLANPYSYMTNVNAFNKRRKPKWIEQMISRKEETVINFRKPSVHNDYGKDCIVAPSIMGENYKDLCDKIDEYLSSIMKIVNKHYYECPKCKGYGVIEVEENESKI